MVGDAMAEEGVSDYWAWFYTPMALPLATQLAPRGVVYDCMDELTVFKHAPRQLVQRENALFKMADLVFTGGRSLYNAKRSRHPDVHCFPSSVDAKHFSRADEHRLLAGICQAAAGLLRRHRRAHQPGAPTNQESAPHLAEVAQAAVAAALPAAAVAATAKQASAA